MKVLLLAEMEIGSIGGGESVVHGLVRGLSAIEREGDEYTVLCPPAMAEWLRPALGAGVQVVCRPAPRTGAAERAKAALGRARAPIGRLARAVTGRAVQGLPMAAPAIDSFAAALDCDVRHFLMPLQFATGDRPSVFTIYDLQHEHLPDVFSADQIRFRRMLYDAVCRDASAIVAISDFTARDFQAHHACDPERLFRVYLGAYADEAVASTVTREDAERLAGLPERFVLYPAYSYRHKNHAGLLTALSLLRRDAGLDVPLVCTGGRSPQWSETLAHARGLHPPPRLLDLGHVSRELLATLYRRAACVVFPSLFEGAGLPLLEAAALRRPLACSDIPVFRELGGDGPVLFDPASPADIAAAVRALWTDAGLADRVSGRLAERVRANTWQASARAHLAIHRYAAGVPLTDSDRDVLARNRAGTAPRA